MNGTECQRAASISGQIVSTTQVPPSPLTPGPNLTYVIGTGENLLPGSVDLAAQLRILVSFRVLRGSGWIARRSCEIF